MNNITVAKKQRRSMIGLIEDIKAIVDKVKCLNEDSYWKEFGEGENEDFSLYGDDILSDLNDFLHNRIINDLIPIKFLNAWGPLHGDDLLFAEFKDEGFDSYSATITMPNGLRLQTDIVGDGEISDYCSFLILDIEDDIDTVSEFTSFYNTRLNEVPLWLKENKKLEYVNLLEHEFTIRKSDLYHDFDILHFNLLSEDEHSMTLKFKDLSFYEKLSLNNTEKMEFTDSTIGSFPMVESFTMTINEIKAMNLTSEPMYHQYLTKEEKDKYFNGLL